MYRQIMNYGEMEQAIKILKRSIEEKISDIDEFQKIFNDYGEALQNALMEDPQNKRIQGEAEAFCKMSDFIGESFYKQLFDASELSADVEPIGEAFNIIDKLSYEELQQIRKKAERRISKIEKENNEMTDPYENKKEQADKFIERKIDELTLLNHISFERKYFEEKFEIADSEELKTRIEIALKLKEKVKELKAKDYDLIYDKEEDTVICWINPKQNEKDPAKIPNIEQAEMVKRVLYKIKEKPRKIRKSSFMGKLEQEIIT